MTLSHTVPEQKMNISKKMTTKETWTFYLLKTIGKLLLVSADDRKSSQKYQRVSLLVLLLERVYSRIGCICLTFLHCAF